ncbi:DNA polymerase, partial [Anaerostipes sp.]
IHDELLIEASLDELDEVKKILKEEMMHAVDLDIPLSIDMNTGENWYEAK